MRRKCGGFIWLGLFAAGSVVASDWPQFRGPNHDSSSPEIINTTWSAANPRRLWKVATPGGFSSFAVGGGKAFTLTLRDINGAHQEICLALDADTGREIWAAPLDVANYLARPLEEGNSGTPDNNGGDGPRSTPSLDGDRVYVTTANLQLYCLDVKTGKIIWEKDLLKENDGKNILWYNSASPLIEGDLVFVAGGGPGQALMGIDKRTGQIRWKGENDIMSHSTPTVATIAGVRQVIFFTAGLVSVEPVTGRVLWRYHCNYNVSAAITPVVAGDTVYCSAGAGVGSSTIRVSKSAGGFTVTRLWLQMARSYNNHWTTPVYKDGYLYGLFGFKEFGTCPLKCIEMTTGKLIWSRDGFGQGGMILVDGNLLVLSDSGKLVLVKATPQAYTEIARTKALRGKCWSTPVVSQGRIYARSTEEAVCLDVSPN